MVMGKLLSLSLKSGCGSTISSRIQTGHARMKDTQAGHVLQELQSMSKK